MKNEVEIESQWDLLKVGKNYESISSNGVFDQKQHASYSLQMKMLSHPSSLPLTFFDDLFKYDLRNLSY